MFLEGTDILQERLNFQVYITIMDEKHPKCEMKAKNELFSACFWENLICSLMWYESCMTPAVDSVAGIPDKSHE